jgi:hypothetical protein
MYIRLFEPFSVQLYSISHCINEAKTIENEEDLHQCDVKYLNFKLSLDANKRKSIFVMGSHVAAKLRLAFFMADCHTINNADLILQLSS